MKTFKELINSLSNKSSGLDEEIKGWKHAGRDIAKARAEASKNAQPVKLHRLKADGTESGMHDAAKHFPSEKHAQDHVDYLHSINPGKKFSFNKYVNGKHVGVSTKTS